MKRNKILTLMAAAMTMTACSVSDITDNIPGNGNSVRVESAKVTRASDTQEPEPMTDDFYLINLTQKEKVDDRYDAVFTYNDGTYTSDADVMWCGSGKNNFVAYYPVKTNSRQNLTPIADVNRFMIPQNQTAEQDSITDWMRATATASKTDNGGSLSLNFEHMLTQVTIVCDYSDYYDDGEDVTVKVNQIYTRTQYCEATTDDQGNVTITPYQRATNGTNGIYVSCDATPMENAPRKTSSTVIIAPGEYKAEHDGSYLYSGLADAGMYVNGTWESNIDIDLPQDMTFEAGKHYTFNVMIKGHDKATISAITVSDWKNETLTLADGTAKKIPYVTFSADAEQVFSMTTSDATANNAKDIIAKLEYSVGNGEWTPLTKNAEVTFGGDKGDLRLRGKAKNGTATGTVDYCIIKFKNKDVKVSCTGDIRTLQDYTDHERVSSSSVRFTGLFMECEALETAPQLPAKSVGTEAYYQMFFKCTSLKTAPELPATRLASECYNQMFYGCTALKYVTMMAPADQITNNRYELAEWLYNAGTSDSPRTLKLSSKDAYNNMIDNNYLPDKWRIGQATVLDKDGNKITE